MKKLWISGHPGAGKTLLATFLRENGFSLPIEETNDGGDALPGEPHIRLDLFEFKIRGAGPLEEPR